MTLTIAGVARTTKLKRGSLAITYTANARTSAEFVVVDNAASPYRPALDDVVVISHDSVTLFEGVVVALDNAPLVHKWGAHVRVTCADYSQLAQRRMVNGAVTTAITTKGVLTELCGIYLPTVAIDAGMANGSARTALSFDMVRLDEVLTAVCDADGWVWEIRNVTGTKTLYAYAIGARTPAAPSNFSYSDTITRGLTWTQTRDVGAYTTSVHLRYKNGAVTRPAVAPATIYDEVVAAPDVETETQANAVADAILARKAITPKLITLVTNTNGYRPGHSVILNFPAHGLNNITCNVQEVRTRELGASSGAVLEHTLDLVETTEYALSGRHSLWLDFYRGAFSGGGAGGTSPAAAITGTVTTVAGGGPTALFLGGSRHFDVVSSSYVDVPDAVYVTLASADFSGLTPVVRAMVRAVAAGTQVKVELWNVTDASQVAESAWTAPGTTWTAATITGITLASGTKVYALRLKGDNTTNGVQAIGYLEA